jgi:hypothetical protein
MCWCGGRSSSLKELILLKSICFAQARLLLEPGLLLIPAGELCFHKRQVGGFNDGDPVNQQLQA